MEMENVTQIIYKIVEILGLIGMWTIALALLAMAIFGGSVELHINGMERWFK